MKVKAEQYIQDFGETLLKLSNVWSEFFILKQRLFTSRTYTNFVIIDQFLLDFCPNKCSDWQTNKL